jgi:hypothetical protein
MGTVLAFLEPSGWIPARLRSRLRVVVPENLGLILYCSSSGELTRERVAVALRKKGISNVWVLEGGLTVWKKEGLPVTLRPSTSSGSSGALRHTDNRGGFTLYGIGS